MANSTIEIDASTAKVQVSFGMPLEGMVLLEAAAKADDPKQTTQEFARKLVADAIGYTLPAMKTRTSKYAGLSEEQRKAEISKAQEEKRNAVKARLEQMRQRAGLAPAPVASAPTEPTA